jgi:hypothetical protein
MWQMLPMLVLEADPAQRARTKHTKQACFVRARTKEALGSIDIILGSRAAAQRKGNAFKGLGCFP